MTDLRPLPSGRHQLTHEEVVSSQRARMLKAMRESMLERGYDEIAFGSVSLQTTSGVSAEDVRNRHAASSWTAS